MIQIAVSINYRKGCKKHILLFCFIIEDIYYCGAIIYLIISSNFFGENVLGIAVVLVFLGIIGTATYELFQEVRT